jgi:hypothetical protein
MARESLLLTGEAMFCLVLTWLLEERDLQISRVSLLGYIAKLLFLNLVLIYGNFTSFFLFPLKIVLQMY